MKKKSKIDRLIEQLNTAFDNILHMTLTIQVPRLVEFIKVNFTVTKDGTIEDNKKI